MNLWSSRLPLNWNKDEDRSSVTMLALVFLSIAPFCLYKIFQDFSKTFLKRPKSFMPAKRFWHFKKVTANVPLVELTKANDYEEVLARGSRLVCSQ